MAGNNLSIRSSQIIAPNGVGALVEIEGQSFFIAGTRDWQETFDLKHINLTNFKKFFFQLLQTV